MLYANLQSDCLVVLGSPGQVIAGISVEWPVDDTEKGMETLTGRLACTGTIRLRGWGPQDCPEGGNVTRCAMSGIILAKIFPILTFSTHYLACDL